MNLAMMMNYSKQFMHQKFEFKSHIFPIAILIFICFWSFFYNNGVVAIDSMEARNLVTAREILENDNWLVPTMNGEVRLAKPPLPTWFAALVSLSVGGTDKLSLLRIPNAVSALLLVCFTYGLAWTLSRDRTLAFMAAAMLATNFLVISMGHKASWDIFSHTFMLGALWAFVDGMRNNRGWRVFAVFGTFMGLSFMSKGPVSFFALLLPFILSYLWIFKIHEFRKKWLLLVLAVAVCSVISSLWPLYIWNFHPEALLATIQQESQAWANRHVQPFWYYSDFPVFNGLWLVITIAVLTKPFAEKRIKSIYDYRFLLLWFILEILLLSAIPEKKSRYLLPAMIPLAILGGTFFRGIMDRYSSGKREKGDLLIVALHTSFISIVGIIFPCFLFYRLHGINEKGTLFLFIQIFPVFLGIVVISWILFSKRKVFGLFCLTILQFCFITFLYMDYYHDVTIRNPEYKSMASVDHSLLPQEMDIFIMQNHLSMKYVWGLKRQIKRWRVTEASQLLKSGKTIMVISRGSPDKKLTKRIGEEVAVQIIDRFDYSKGGSEKEKLFLSRVRLKE